MSLVVVSVYPERVKENREFWDDFTVWTPTQTEDYNKQESIRLAYQELATQARNDGWDESVMVIQDDIRLTGEAEHQGDITSYVPPTEGTRTFHCCPRAFTATHAGWGRLIMSWSSFSQVCRSWRPDHFYDLAEVIE
jgi:hypothetical protein